EAARAAREAFDTGPWRRMDGGERGKLLLAAAERFRREAPALIELTIAETGAVRPVAERLQVAQAGERLARFGALASEPAEKALSDVEARAPWGGGPACRPLGGGAAWGVACISPFNFPMTNCAGKLGPALAAGNTVVVKPAPQDPLGVAELCRMVDAVLPPGVVNFVCGSGPEIGEALTLAPEVDMISFTGSTTVGRAIQTAVGHQMKRTLQELGGKSADVVFADADLSRALAGSMSVWTFHAGQICTAPTRLLVEQSIYAAFPQRPAAAAGSVKVGDPRDEGVVMGPLVSAAQRERVERFIAQGVAEGARLACGGRRPPHLPRGYYV